MLNDWGEQNRHLTKNTTIYIMIFNIPTKHPDYTIYFLKLISLYSFSSKSRNISIRLKVQRNFSVPMIMMMIQRFLQYLCIIFLETFENNPNFALLSDYFNFLLSLEKLLFLLIDYKLYDENSNAWHVDKLCLHKWNARRHEGSNWRYVILFCVVCFWPDIVLLLSSCSGKWQESSKLIPTYLQVWWNYGTLIN